MYLSTEAIVLELKPYKDNNAIVKLYTRRLGLVTCWVGSIRSKTTHTPLSMLQPFSISNASLSFRENNTLFRLKELELLRTTDAIKCNMEKISIAIFLSELLVNILKEHSPEEELYKYIENAILLLNDTREKCSGFHLFFMTGLLRHCGLSPKGSFSINTRFLDWEDGAYREVEPLHPFYFAETESRWHSKVMEMDMDDFYKVSIPSEIRKRILYGLLEYFRIHLGTKPLKSHLVFEEVF